ncbi:MAG: FtsH protease activity modulator HflK [Desulfatiglandaceae bacterium]
MVDAETKSDVKRVFSHARTLSAWLIFLLILLYLASGFYSVKPEQRGVLKRFGRVVTDNILPGIHYRVPWPIESVVRLSTTEIRSMTVQFQEVKGPKGAKVKGSQVAKVKGSQVAKVKGTQVAKVKGTQVAKHIESKHVERPAPVLTADENLVISTLVLQYTISQPKSYLYNTSHTDWLLRRIVQAATVSKLAEMGVDDILTIGRLKMQTTLKEGIQAKIDIYDLGIRLFSVQIQSIGPPADVAGAFRDVTSAREDKQKIIQQAKGDRNRRLPKARAESNQMKREAEGYANEIVERAKGDAHRFTAAWNEYRKAKNLTAHRLYLEALEEILPKVRKMIFNPQAERHIPVPRTHLSKELASPLEVPSGKEGQPR